MLTLSSPISSLKGIGTVRAQAFSKLGLYSLRDVLYHFPRAYQNRGDIKKIVDVGHGETAAFLLTVGTVPYNAKIKKGMTLTKFRAFDSSDSLEVVFFNQPYLKDFFVVGGEYRFWGKIVKGKKNAVMLSSPAYEKYEENKPLSDFVPIYPLTDTLTQKLLKDAVGEALGCMQAELRDNLPMDIRRKRELCTLSYALSEIHKPEDIQALRTAGRRLSYDEMFYYALCTCAFSKSSREPRRFYMNDTDIREFLLCIDFPLTASQKRVIGEISRDLSCSDMTVPSMSRILVGDVGSGKTVCAAAALYIAAKNGMQSALMAPTEILATQHYNDLFPIFSSLGIKCELLLGATKKSEKDRIKRALVSEVGHRCDIVIGTHAILSDGVDFSQLGLVVTDEQHRFGVRQRTSLSEKGEGVHVLVMTATPIPRTMSLVLYKDIDVSTLDEMPQGRQRVDTFCVDESYRQRLNGFIRKQVDEGGQVYIVCPTVAEAESEEEEAAALDASELFELAYGEQSPPLKAAVDYARELSEKVFPDISVGFLHGKMKSREKDEVMGKFVSGEIKILVSTTVIEVGVNVPSATLMIVENAERFGLSQLHQLRGRVGRGSKKSYCVLVSDSKGEAARKRLNIMKKTYDGFSIAERDLKMRGPGDFFASASLGSKVRQSGDNAFKMAGLCSDEGLMEAAFADAAQIWQNRDKTEQAKAAVLYARELYNIDKAALN